MMEYVGLAAEAAATSPTASNMKNLEKHLLMGSLTIAHELVHFFAGRIIGVPETDTPDKINAPPELSRVKGESGRFWEDKFVGYNIEAFFDPADPLKEKQAGKLWADKKQSRVAPADQNLVDHAWVKTMLAGSTYLVFPSLNWSIFCDANFASLHPRQDHCSHSQTQGEREGDERDQGPGRW